MCVDLHTHSIYSDGTFTPLEIIQLAKRSYLQAIALTDHDTLDGIEEFLKYGEQENIVVFSGLEVSAVHKNTSMHILGYGVDHTSAALKEWLVLLQKGRMTRNQKIIEKLQKQNINITIEELEEFSSCGQCGRPHIAKLLQSKGLVKSLDQAFSLYLKKGASAYSNRFCYSATQTIDIIHRAGGLAVLAHPGQTVEKSSLPFLIAELSDIGLDGLEAYYPSHSKQTKKKLISLAKKHKLILTGGSDFHGNNHSICRLAGTKNRFCPPDSIIQDIQKRLQTIQDTNTSSFGTEHSAQEKQCVPS